MPALKLPALVELLRSRLPPRVPALQRAAMRSSIRRWGVEGQSTPHTTVLSHEAVVFAVICFGGAAFVYNLHEVLGTLDDSKVLRIP